jgi:hypothetical protein
MFTLIPPRDKVAFGQAERPRAQGVQLRVLEIWGELEIAPGGGQRLDRVSHPSVVKHRAMRRG